MKADQFCPAGGGVQTSRFLHQGACLGQADLLGDVDSLHDTTRLQDLTTIREVPCRRKPSEPSDDADEVAAAKVEPKASPALPSTAPVEEDFGAPVPEARSKKRRSASDEAIDGSDTREGEMAKSTGLLDQAAKAAGDRQEVAERVERISEPLSTVSKGPATDTPGIKSNTQRGR